VIGTITSYTSHLASVQVTSTGPTDRSLLGQEIPLRIPRTSPIYFGGRVAAGRDLAVGDAIIAIIVPDTTTADGTTYYRAHEIDDLGR
jgi:hypothetical protein